MSLLAPLLRKCKSCGLEAYTEEDLEAFCKHQASPYGRRRLCRSCSSRAAMDDRAYLRKKFNDMQTRCYNSNREKYQLWGGRGITICQEWSDNPDRFIDWALANGFKRELQIDRKDNMKGYSPDNCRFVTPIEQARNTRRDTTDWKNKTRICSSCREKKPFSEFYHNKSRVGGRDYLCIPCEKERKSKGVIVH